jgi:FkbM family methyltransferase
MLKKRGFAPKHIVDIGANHGNWTRTALRYFPEAYYTLVEPQDHLRTHVQDFDGRIRWIGAGASDEPATAEAAKAAAKRQIEVPVTTLNKIVRTSDALFPNMVKIDPEGFDLQVVAGASKLVGKTDIFLLEVMICAKGEDNAWENNAWNVIQAMAHAGYRIPDTHDLNRSPKYGVLWLSEVAFLRDSPTRH